MSTFKTLLLLALPALFLSCGDPKETGASEQALVLPVIEIPRRELTAFYNFPTTIEGEVNSEVRAKVSGYITDVWVDEGQQVRKDQPLFKLETQSLSQEASAAKANVNAAQVEVDKLRPLVDQEIISNVQLETANAKLEQAKSSYNSIIASIGYATIKSPVDGVVGSINFRKGSLVSPQDQRPLTRVSSIEEVFAYFAVNEKAFLGFTQPAEGTTLEQKIRNLPPVTLYLANGDEYTEKGRIETISGEIDQETGSVTFRARFANARGILRNGSSGIVSIPQTFSNAIVVPQASTFERQGETFVYLVQGDTMAVSQLIVPGVNSGNLLVVESGLAEGDIIVGRGLGQLRNNTLIKPDPVAFDSIANSIKTVFK